MATFDTPDYIMGNSAGITTSLSTVLTTLDQALQALEPAPSATIVRFNTTVRCDAGSTTRTDMTDTTITQTETAVGTITYMPTFVLPAVSNQSIQIPPFSIVPHQIAMQSAPITLIDKLEVQAYSITAGETVNCFGYNGATDFYLGCESGNVYWFDASIPQWTLMMTFDNAVRVLYFHTQSGKMYIGGKFDSMTFPSSIAGLNKVCFSTTFPLLYSSIAVDIFFNYGVNGFNNPVNAITGDGSWIYFGGEFTTITGSALSCLYIAVYDVGTGSIYSLDNTNGYGFNNTVFGLNLITDKLAITGQFNQLNISTSYSPAYCCCLTLSGGWGVSNVEYLYGSSGALTTPIDILNSVQGDGSVFWISTKSTNINGNGVNYMIQAPYSSFPSNTAVGSNEFINPQTSYNLFDTIGSVSNTDSVYLKFGAIQATLPFSPLFIYWNVLYSRQEFIDMTTGFIYAFTGSSNNTFTLQNSREIRQGGATYTIGFTMTPTGNGYGFSSTLLWNGSYYITSSINGGSAN